MAPFLGSKSDERGLLLNYKPYKCIRCGWVHSATPLEIAQEQVRTVNAWLAAKGEPESTAISSYMNCFQCGATTDEFVPALPGDAPTGSTTQGIVVPGAFDG